MGNSRKVNIKWFIVCAICLLVGCSMFTNRSGSEWIDLAYAGLVAEDDFRFTGSVASGFEDGLQVTPFSFEGTIAEHKQVALYATESNSMVKNPLSEFEFIKKNNTEATILYDGLDEAKEHHIVVLQVVANNQAVTARVKEQLRQELSNVTIKAISSAEQSHADVKKISDEATKATNELEKMLTSLDASKTYKITIDALSAKPIKMDENLSMTYQKNNTSLKEFRKTNINFDMSGYSSP